MNNRLKISYLLRAIPLRMFNGSTTSTIDRMCHLPIMFSTSESHMMDLFITKLDEEYLVVLGYNWLTQHNPSIDWVEMKITFQDPRKGKPPEKPPSPTPEAIDIHLVSERTMKKLSVRVQPCALDSALFRCISKALPCTLTHCILDSTCYTTLHCPLHLCLHMCPSACLFVCLSVSPSRLFPLIDGQWTGAKSDCAPSIRRGLGRRLRSSLLLNSSPSTSRDHPLVT